LTIVALESGRDVGRVIDLQNRWLAGEKIDGASGLWVPGSAVDLQVPGVSGMIVDLSKLDPRVKFLACYVRQA